MSGRHRNGGIRSRGRASLVLVAILALLGVTAVTVRIVSAGAASCTGSLPMRVVTTPELTDVVQGIAATWTATEPQVGGECVELTVEGRSSATVASGLTVYAGRAIDTGSAPEPTPSEDTLPTVWIPDSIAWINRVQIVDRAAFFEDLRSVASSPVIVAVPEPAAAQIGWPAPLPVAGVKTLLGQGKLKLGIAEPRRETASLAATMVLGEALASSDEELPALVQTFRSVAKTASTGELLQILGGDKATAGPASEQAVLAHNAGAPAVPLVAARLEPSGAQLDYPYAIRSGISRPAEQAAEQFRAQLLSGAAAAALAAKGFRAPDGTVGPGFPSSTATNLDPFAGQAVDDPAAVQRALGLWSAANSPSRTLALFDVTASMGTQVGNGATRATMMVSAAQGGLQLFTGDSRLGMWAFGAQHQEVMEIGDLTPDRKAELNQRMVGARPTASNQSQLYSTLVAAYQLMRDGYDPTRPNLIVVLTDGGDSDQSPLRLEQFNQDMQRLADPTKPIRVVLIGISVDSADATNLQAIADIVGGGFFPLTSPEQIQTIFLKALLRVGAA